MEEQEKIDIREHLIGWIDTFLEDGIVPQVVNPKAIRTNYILKSKIKEKIEEIEKEIDNLVQNGDIYKDNVAKYNYLKTKVEVLQELMED